MIIFPLSRQQVVREEGDILWPAREGRAELAAAKQRLGSFAFQCQYLQAPVARGGNLFKAGWFCPYSATPACFDRIIQSWDCAFRTATTSDYSACVTLGEVQSRGEDGVRPGLYLLHAWHGKIEFPTLKRLAVEFHGQWQPDAVLIEAAASGLSLAQELRVDTSLPIIEVKPESDKYTPAAAVSPTLEAGRFFVPERAPWLGEYIAELTAFPGGAHDDWLDATVQGLSYARTARSGVLDYWRELNERAARGENPWINPDPSYVDPLTPQYEQTIARLQGRAHCAYCHNPIGKTNIVDQGDRRYHATCFNLSQAGGGIR